MNINKSDWWNTVLDARTAHLHNLPHIPSTTPSVLQKQCTLFKHSNWTQHPATQTFTALDTPTKNLSATLTDHVLANPTSALQLETWLEKIDLDTSDTYRLVEHILSNKQHLITTHTLPALAVAGLTNDHATRILQLIPEIITSTVDYTAALVTLISITPLPEEILAAAAYGELSFHVPPTKLADLDLLGRQSVTTNPHLTPDILSTLLDFYLDLRHRNFDHDHLRPILANMKLVSLGTETVTKILATDPTAAAEIVSYIVPSSLYTTATLDALVCTKPYLWADPAVNTSTWPAPTDYHLTETEATIVAELVPTWTSTLSKLFDTATAATA